MGWSKVLICLGLFVAVLATFVPALRNDFVGYDDPVYVTENQRVQSGLSWPNVAWAFASSEAGNWHPLTWLSHMADVQCFGLKAFGHHLSSVLLHVANTLLLFLVVQRMTGSTWRSAAVALLFGVHPLRVESVAWVAERKDVLSGFFWLLTLLAYTKYVEALKGNRLKDTIASSNEIRCWLLRLRQAPVRRWYLASILFFALGLMSKPMLVTLPFVLCLLDYWPLNRMQEASGLVADRVVSNSNRRRIASLLLEKIPLLLMAAVASWVTYLVQKKGGAIQAMVPLLDRSINALVAYVRYLGKVFWPSDLAVFYPRVQWPLVVGLLAMLFIVAITVLAFGLRRRLPPVFVGWLWFVGTLVPVIGLVQAGEQSLADRYTYIPSMGLLVMLVWFLATFAPNGRWRALSLGAAVAVGAGFCISRTREQISHWRNTEALFSHALTVTTGNYLAHYNLGTALERNGRLEEALREFGRAIAVKPDYAEAYNNIGIVLDKKGQLAEALVYFGKAVELKTGYADAHNNRGVTLEKLHRREEAIAAYQAALQANPQHGDALYNLGVALARTGRLAEAIDAFAASLKVRPNSPDAHNNLGVALDNLGRTQQAIGHYRQALKLNPRYASAHFNLGVALAKNGRIDEAITEFKEALRLRPGYREAERNLSALEAARQSGKQ